MAPSPPTPTGCDVGGTALKFVRLRGRRLVAAAQSDTPRGVSGKELARLVADGLLRLGARRLGDAPALGVALPGYLDAGRRRVLHSTHLPGIEGYPLRAELERRLGSRVSLETDSNAGAVAEAALGAGRGHGRVLYLTLGTGLGAALVARGEIVRASHHTAGHVAHLPLLDRGLRCPCGQWGCAEALLGARGLLARAGGSATSPLELFRRALDGDRAARAVWDETGELLGRLLRILVPLLEPEVVIIGGGQAGASRFFLPAARHTLRRRLPRGLARAVRVQPARLGSLAGAVGAALRAPL